MISAKSEIPLRWSRWSVTTLTLNVFALLAGPILVLACPVGPVVVAATARDESDDDPQSVKFAIKCVSLQPPRECHHSFALTSLPACLHPTKQLGALGLGDSEGFLPPATHKRRLAHWRLCESAFRIPHQIEHQQPLRWPPCSLVCGATDSR